MPKILGLTRISGAAEGEDLNLVFSSSAYSLLTELVCEDLELDEDLGSIIRLSYAGGYADLSSASEEQIQSLYRALRRAIPRSIDWLKERKTQQPFTDEIGALIVRAACVPVLLSYMCTFDSRYQHSKSNSSDADYPRDENLNMSNNDYHVAFELAAFYSYWSGSEIEFLQVGLSDQSKYPLHRKRECALLVNGLNSAIDDCMIIPKGWFNTDVHTRLMSAMRRLKQWFQAQA